MTDVAGRLQYYIDELGKFGRQTSGGITRPVYSPAWVDARNAVTQWMEAAGLETHSDAVGNLFGRASGREAGLVLTGSHLDTVPNGGAYDGALGIIAGLCAVQMLLEEKGPPRKTIEVLATCEEEGSRFPANFWGARCMTGTIDPAELSSLKDREGATIGSVMSRLGFQPEQLSISKRTDIEAFLELHIEQGPIMEQSGLPVGVVRAITGQCRAMVTVAGRADHAGTTPMDMRSDAYVAAAEMAVTISSVATKMGRPAVATVGRVDVTPGAINVVPAQVAFSVDARHPESAAFAELVTRLRESCNEIAKLRGTTVSWEQLMYEQPQPMDEQLCSLVSESAQELGIKSNPMFSGAGHDSQVMARAFPTAMLFVPSRDGRSHSPAEFTPVEQIVPGVRVLAKTIEKLAY